IGVARYLRIDDTDRADVAFVVEDAFQGRGVGMLLFEHLVEAAWRRRIRTFVADTLFDNFPMLRVFADMGFAVTQSRDSGVVHLTFPIDTTAQSENRADARELEARMSS